MLICDIMNIECQLCLHTAIKLAGWEDCPCLVINVIGEQCGGSATAGMIWSAECGEVNCWMKQMASDSESKKSSGFVVYIAQAVEYWRVGRPRNRSSRICTSTGMCCHYLGENTYRGDFNSTQDMICMHIVTHCTEHVSANLMHNIVHRCNLVLKKTTGAPLATHKTLL